LWEEHVRLVTIEELESVAHIASKGDRSRSYIDLDASILQRTENAGPIHLRSQMVEQNDQLVPIVA
jgi:hypothetical protein